MIIHQITGCPDHDDCSAATEERATDAVVDDEAIVYYRAKCDESGAEWNSVNDEEISRHVIASTLHDYQRGYYIDYEGNRINEPLESSDA